MKLIYFYGKKTATAIVHLILGLIPFGFYSTFISTVAYAPRLSARMLWLNQGYELFFALFAAGWLLYEIIRIAKLGWRYDAKTVEQEMMAKIEAKRVKKVHRQPEIKSVETLKREAQNNTKPIKTNKKEKKAKKRGKK